MAENVLQICNVIRQTAYELHAYLRGGHLEKVYENGLVHRLGVRGLKVLAQHPLTVRDKDGTVLGQYCADLFVEDCLIVELKACRTLSGEHIGQLFGYLRACGIEHGLLVNFGPAKVEFKTYVLSQPGLCEEPEDE